MNSGQTYKAIVLGASSGGMKLVNELITALPEDFFIPVLIVLHVADTSDNTWARLLDERSQVHVKEADEKEHIEKGVVYLAPANYHLLLEPDLTLTLTVDERVNYARPSIDVLFETAADSCRGHVIGIVGTGANSDGANGLLRVKQCGGLTIVQDPETAEAKSMPLAAIQLVNPHHILSPEAICEFLLTMHNDQMTSCA